MSNWPLRDAGLGVVSPMFVNPDQRDRVLGTPAATPGWSAWVEASASWPVTTEAITIRVELNDDAAPRRYLVRVGIGAAGSEVVIATVPWFLTTGYRGTYAASFTLPVRVPRGVRVAVSFNTGGGSVAAPVRGVVLAHPGSPLEPVGFTEAVLVGVNEGTMLPTLSTTVGYASEVITEAVGSTTRRVRGISLTQLSFPGSAVAWDVLIGPAGAEAPLILGAKAYTPFQLATYAHAVPVSRVAIPAGTRIALRGRQGGGSGIADVALHLFY